MKYDLSRSYQDGWSGAFRKQRKHSHPVEVKERTPHGDGGRTPGEERHGYFKPLSRWLKVKFGISGDSSRLLFPNQKGRASNSFCRTDNTPGKVFFTNLQCPRGCHRRKRDHTDRYSGFRTGSGHSRRRAPLPKYYDQQVVSLHQGFTAGIRRRPASTWLFAQY